MACCLSRVMVVAAALALGACGVRGNLETPPDGRAPQATATADSGQGKPEDAAPKPHRGFLLDWLIR